MNTPARSETASELASLFAAIEKLNHRLDRLERNTERATHQHPSLDKLSIVEAIAESAFQKKACQFEPDKPCDHCSMCNTRGF